MHENNQTLKQHITEACQNILKRYGQKYVYIFPVGRAPDQIERTIRNKGAVAEQGLEYLLAMIPVSENSTEMITVIGLADTAPDKLPKFHIVETTLNFGSPYLLLYTDEVFAVSPDLANEEKSMPDLLDDSVNVISEHASSEQLAYFLELLQKATKE